MRFGTGLPRPSTYLDDAPIQIQSHVAGLLGPAVDGWRIGLHPLDGLLATLVSRGLPPTSTTLRSMAVGVEWWGRPGFMTAWQRSLITIAARHPRPTPRTRTRRLLVRPAQGRAHPGTRQPPRRPRRRRPPRRETPPQEHADIRRRCRGGLRADAPRLAHGKHWSSITRFAFPAARQTARLRGHERRGGRGAVKV